MTGTGQAAGVPVAERACGDAAEAVSFSDADSRTTAPEPLSDRSDGIPEPAPVVKPLFPIGSRWCRIAPDLTKTAIALAVIVLAAAIWYKPPLIRANFPYLSYRFDNRVLTDAVLYRPLAMPTRYYIMLPAQRTGRYAWFAVDRRREVVALAEAPQHRFLGQPAIRRSDPLGLDLEFRKLDGSEWRIFFFDDAIVFSNNVLAVRLDISTDARADP
ncbi:MAG TPA: hypothetical protein PLH01_06705 [Kiritimatiellia bacterium]|nr:hypothetical protein [Kiritimatiellia bacterium]